MPFADAMDLRDDYRDRPPVHILAMLQAIRAGAWEYPAVEAEDGDGAPADWPRGPVKGA